MGRVRLRTSRKERSMRTAKRKRRQGRPTGKESDDKGRQLYWKGRSEENLDGVNRFRIPLGSFMGIDAPRPTELVASVVPSRYSPAPPPEWGLL